MSKEPRVARAALKMSSFCLKSKDVYFKWGFAGASTTSEPIESHVKGQKTVAVKKH